MGLMTGGKKGCRGKYGEIFENYRGILKKTASLS
jgi:hypothetical protein